MDTHKITFVLKYLNISLVIQTEFFHCICTVNLLVQWYWSI